MFEKDSGDGMPKGGEAANLINCLLIDGKNGKNRGNASR